MPETAEISLHLFDGARQPLRSNVSWMARISDGRPLSSRQTLTYSDLHGHSKSFHVTFFDNLFDDYTTVVSPAGFNDSGWYPVRVHPGAPASLDILTLPKNGELNFADATWRRLQTERPTVAEIIRVGSQSDAAAQTSFGLILENRPKALACFLNIVTAMAEMRLPSGKTPLDYYWNIAWPPNSDSPDWLSRLDLVLKQDRFFCYVDAALLPDVRLGSQKGIFAPEPNPGVLHSGATESYKQIQFDVSNVQLTFHGQDTAVLLRADGTPVNCIKIEPDIDYYKDLLNHGLLEVFPNWFTQSRTEPSVAFALRWMAGQRAGLPSFDPLYTVQAQIAGAVAV